ncbi:polysaccharide deacetylase family protein [Paracoccus sp. CPCC 101403]|uniref:Polysaccharide deacetylase family protein n=2 Tax=Paracoccus broussonetiae TaxID=3075834 RepID=A0ABU3EHB9_9RHOB|nr:polysaccharide deacetylase family protein [Paracoccus sp. CPCC 101403]MDT1063642.1 polysaccharide deacetylase family protein [Paracoccus sp. CPCC 101403]
MIQVFRRALAAASDQGRVLRFWLRDDDATRPGPRLERLISLCERHGVPPTLAVVPAGLDPALGGLLTGDARVALHGWSHRNHAGPREKKQELGPHRPAAEVLAELAEGRDLLGRVFPGRVLDLLVPPWNRIAPAVAEGLPGIGIRALSAYGRINARALPVLNADIDPIDWRARRSLRDPALLWQKLALRAQIDRPIGILTHHLDHDEAVWQFLDLLMGMTAGPHCRWITPEEMMPDLLSKGVTSFSSRSADRAGP